MPHSERFEFSALVFRFVYSMSGLLLGAGCVIGGIKLFLRGIGGSTSWTASVMGSETAITDAGPGAVLFVVGLFVIFVTRYRVKVKEESNKGRKSRSVYLLRKPFDRQ